MAPPERPLSKSDRAPQPGSGPGGAEGHRPEEIGQTTDTNYWDTDRVRDRIRQYKLEYIRESYERIHGEEEPSVPEGKRRIYFDDPGYFERLTGAAKEYYDRVQETNEQPLIKMAMLSPHVFKTEWWWFSGHEGVDFFVKHQPWFDVDIEDDSPESADQGAV